MLYQLAQAGGGGGGLGNLKKSYAGLKNSFFISKQIFIKSGQLNNFLRRERQIHRLEVSSQGLVDCGAEAFDGSGVNGARANTGAVKVKILIPGD